MHFLSIVVTAFTVYCVGLIFGFFGFINFDTKETMEVGNRSDIWDYATTEDLEVGL